MTARESVPRRVVVFGNTRWAELVYFYLTHDSDLDVVGFTVDRAYVREPALFGLPVVPFEDVERVFPPAEHSMIVGISFQRMNRLRQERYLAAKAKGYALASYVSTRAVTWPGFRTGENSLILPQTVVHPFATIGNNVTIGSNASVGHHAVIEDHVFVAAGAVILSGVTIEPSCVIGAGATIKQGVRIARECFIGMGVPIHKNTAERQAYMPPRPVLLPKRTDQLDAWLSWTPRPDEPGG